MSGREPSPADGARDPSSALRVALGVVAILVLLYSVLILAEPLLGAMVVVWLVGFYFLWRFVHLAGRLVEAVERIADAMEAPDGPPASRESERNVRDREY